jgi:hypothetical protein
MPDLGEEYGLDREIDAPVVEAQSVRGIHKSTASSWVALPTMAAGAVITRGSLMATDCHWRHVGPLVQYLIQDHMRTADQESWRRPSGLHADGQVHDLNCQPSAFQELYHPKSTYLEKAPTAQLTRIDAADRLFCVPLT